MLSFMVLFAGISGAYSYVCNPEVGTNNNVLCISKTQFVLPFQDPVTDPPLSCPTGTVCADVVGICSATDDPVCLNTVPGAGLCNECDPAVTATVPICQNQTAFAFCAFGKLLTNLVQPCLAPTPYCKVIDGRSTCTADTKLLDCPVSENCNGTGCGNSTDPETETFNCTSAGFFPDTSDSTCVSYFKCQQNAQGGYDKLTFKCSNTGTAFDPAQTRCVPATAFICKNG